MTATLDQINALTAKIAIDVAIKEAAEKAAKEAEERAARKAAGLPEIDDTPPQQSTYVDTDEKWDAQALVNEALGRTANGRNNAGLWLACQARDEGYSQSEAESILTDYQSRVADPSSYSLGEALATVRSSYRRPPRDKRKRRAVFQPDSSYAYGFSGSGTWQPQDLPDNQIREIFASYPQSDEGNAQCMFRAFPNRYLFCDAYGWMAYTGSHWESENAEARLDRDINNLLAGREQVIRESGDDPRGKVMGNAGNVRGCKYHLQSMVTISVKEFDNEPDLLNCKNGVVDLMTGELWEHEPEQRFTYRVNRTYVPFADWAFWEEWLTPTLKGGAAIVEYVQTSLGYSLTGYTREEVLFYLFGPPRSGKGTFTETITAMLGTPLSKEVDFQTFAEKRNGDNQNFDLAPLKPTRFVAASESGKYQSLNAPRVKAITGGNDIHCAFKHKDFFSYRPQFKIWLSSNNNVNTDVDDAAMWARLRVIEFPNSHVGTEDKTLKQQMKTEARLDAIFSWAVFGSVRWFGSKNGLALPDVIKQSTDEARDSVDFVQQFIDEVMLQFDEELPKDATEEARIAFLERKAAFTKKQERAYITNADLYFAYKTWCDDNGITPKQKRSLSLALSAKNYQIAVQMRVEGKKHRCVIGITSASSPMFLPEN